MMSNSAFTIYLCYHSNNTAIKPTVTDTEMRRVLTAVCTTFISLQFKQTKGDLGPEVSLAGWEWQYLPTQLFMARLTITR